MWETVYRTRTPAIPEPTNESEHALSEAQQSATASWLALVRCAGLGASLGSRLLERIGPPQVILDAGPARWRRESIPEPVCKALANPDWDGVDRDLRWLEQPNHHLITREDPRYPARLKEIARPPLALFVNGDPDLLSMPQLAVVGSRNPTRGGKEHAREFSAFMARSGLVITSGLALGIDGEAHRAALKAEGTSLAVTATGPDKVYPARHRDLMHQLVENGVAVSEFPLGTGVSPGHFPQRNRIISGLSLGVLVVEAARKSGSLITAHAAMEEGREVFALPGSIDNPLAKGCHALIRQGAKLIETADDLLEELAPLLGTSHPFQQNPEPVPSNPPELDGEYALLLDAMGYEPVHMDTLVEDLELTPGIVSSMLLQLELRGLVEQTLGGAYVRSPAQAGSCAH